MISSVVFYLLDIFAHAFGLACVNRINNNNDKKKKNNTYDQH